MKSVIVLIPLVFGSAFGLQCVSGNRVCDNNEEGSILLLFQVTEEEE